MARVELAPKLLDDLDRIFDHLETHDSQDPDARIQAIVDAVQILESSPQMGRPASDELRELVIGSGARGYVALYRYVAELDTVFVLAIRGQREAGYK